MQEPGRSKMRLSASPFSAAGEFRCDDIDVSVECRLEPLSAPAQLGHFSKLLLRFAYIACQNCLRTVRKRQ